MIKKIMAKATTTTTVLILVAIQITQHATMVKTMVMTPNGKQLHP